MKNKVEGTAKVRKQREIVLSGDEKLDALRAGKRADIARYRARKKLQAQGVLIPEELSIRTVHKHALKVENFKVVLKDGTQVRMSRNGGEKVALTFTHPDGKKERKGFVNIQAGVAAFKKLK